MSKSRCIQPWSLSPMVTPHRPPETFDLNAALTNLGQNPLQLLQQLWEGVSYGIFVLDVLGHGDNFRYAAFNPTCARNSPVPVEYLLGNTLDQVLPLEVSTPYYNRYRHSVQTGDSISFEEYFCHEGEESWWLLTINPLLNDANEIHQLLVTCVDITARAKLEVEHQRLKADLEVNEAKFRRLVETANDVIAAWGLDTAISYLSPSFQTASGYNPADWIGKSFVPLVHPDDVAICQKFNQQVVETGEQSPEFEFRQCNAAGGWNWVAITVVPIKDSNGNVIEFQGMIRNIDDRKRAESQLEDSLEQQALLNQLMNQMRHSLDFDTIIASAIQSIRELLEIDCCSFAWYESEGESPTWQIVQESVLPDFPSSIGIYPATLVGNIENLVKHDEILVINRLDDCIDHIHRQFLEMIGTKSELLLPIRTRTNKVGVIICINYAAVRPWSLAEIILMKAINNQLAIAIEQADLYAESQAKSLQLQQTLQVLQSTQAKMVQSEKMSSLGQLVAGIAHEINNPVNFIHGNVKHTQDYVQDLLDLIELYQATYPQVAPAIVDKIAAIDLEFIQTDLPKSLSSMQVGTSRIREIVKSLRLFSRLDEAEVKPVNIHEGIDSTLMILQGRLKSTYEWAGITVVKEYSELPQVECFAGQLNQVFMNILVNAIDALEDRDQKRAIAEQKANPSQIRIKTEMTSDQQVLIWIADNGVGIPVAAQPHIFDPFFTTKTVGKGTGMGMSISYQIITEKHGGQICFDSVPGQGTEFVIQIPSRQNIDG
jgi:two-component system, NtrC family, sensor kinase